MNWILIYFAIKYKGDFDAIYSALKNNEIANKNELLKIRKMIDDNQIKAITIVDDNYPDSLKEINKPPFVIFYEGNIDLINNTFVLFTGEFLNDYISKFVSDSINELSKHYSLVSCNFKSLDKSIIESYLSLNKNVVIVLPNGVEHDFDLKKYDKNLLIISESPLNTNINKKRLHQRNRLAVGLSKMLIIASSYKKSSIMNLVTFSLEQGKDIYCFPGIQLEIDGNNLLIQEGANLITSIKSIN